MTIRSVRLPSSIETSCPEMMSGRFAPAGATEAAPMAASNIAAIGQVLYGKYLFLFESAGIILLVAMVGAIVLTHRERKDTRPQNVAKQNARRPWEATVNMRPEVGKGVEL